MLFKNLKAACHHVDMDAGIISALTGRRVETNSEPTFKTDMRTLVTIAREAGRALMCHHWTDDKGELNVCWTSYDEPFVKVFAKAD